MLAVQCDASEKTCCALLDVRSNSPCWQPMASAAGARGFHAVASVGDYSVVMLGGWNVNCDSTDTAQLYDVRGDRWSERPEWCLPVRSSGHCAAVID